MATLASIAFALILFAFVWGVRIGYTFIYTLFLGLVFVPFGMILGWLYLHFIRPYYLRQHDRYQEPR